MLVVLGLREKNVAPANLDQKVSQNRIEESQNLRTLNLSSKIADLTTMPTKSEIKIFNHPRPQKSLLPPPSKRRKVDHKIEEISFDFDARADYLTGFHKRKVQRTKQAQLEAEKKAKEEKIVIRKQVR